MNECLGEITVFEKMGGPLSKRIALRDGKIVNDSSFCRMANGSARRVKIEATQLLADLINAFTASEAYALGRLKGGHPERVRVVRRDELNGTTDPSVIARTKEYLVFSEGEPGLALLDVDLKGLPEDANRRMAECGGVWGVLCEVLPALETVGFVERASTSSGLRNGDTGETIAGSGGFHIVIPVLDVADSPRFLSDLHDRLWLKGFGWGMVSAAGSFLERALVDRAVGSPERLIFEGPPVIEPPLEQAPRLARAQDGDILDTRTACPSLTDAEKDELKKLKDAEAARLKPTLGKAREEWSVSHIERMTAAGLPEAEARARIDRWLARRELSGDFPLPFDDPELAGMTVEQVLTAPDRYVKKTLADPIEGPGYGRGKAILFRRDNGSLFINSFAHGGGTYELKSTLDTEIERLAKLSRRQFEQERIPAAKRLKVRVSTLDELVAEARGDNKGEQEAPALYEHWNVEPASNPVDGSILVRAIKEAIQRYVFTSIDLAVALTLWVVFSWLDEHVTHSPLLFVTSADKDSGKSTLLGVLNFLTRRSLQNVDISGAALFRSIAKWQPTLIVDEADDALADNPDLRSVINSGWTRGQGAIRCHPDTHEPELFSTFAPKIVAMKGRNLPDTTLSRAITITMKPRRASEHVADFNHLDNETFVRLRSQLARWSADNAAAIARATPEIPPGFYNRRRANWMSLLAIAEACEWKTEAWKAALAIEAIADTFDPSIGIELLRAIKAVFDARAEAPKDKDRIKSEDLIKELVTDATARWATYNKGKPISERQVAGLLKNYEIKPKTIRLDDGTGKSITAKGYLLEWFIDAFARYRASSEEADVTGQGEEDTSSSSGGWDSSVTSVTSLFSQGFSQFSIRHKPNDVTDKKDGKTFDINNVTDVTDKKGGGKEKGYVGPSVTDEIGEEHSPSSHRPDPPAAARSDSSPRAGAQLSLLMGDSLPRSA
jgi:hypothetical protein